MRHFKEILIILLWANSNIKATLIYTEPIKSDTP